MANLAVEQPSSLSPSRFAPLPPPQLPPPPHTRIPPPTAVSEFAASPSAAAGFCVSPPPAHAATRVPIANGFANDCYTSNLGILSCISSLLPQLSISRMEPASHIFCLRWNNHRTNLLNVFDHHLQTEAFCDVTLACDGASVKCHKMILSACSSYFQQLFLENTCEHPIVFLKDIKYDEIKAILDYMYKGEVNVAQDHLPGLLKVADLLKVKGLVEEEREKLLNSGKEGRPLVGGNADDADGKKVNGEGKDSSPPSTSSSGGLPGPMPRPFMYTPPAGGPQFPLWPLPGMFPGAHSIFGRAAAAGGPGGVGENGNASSSSSDAAGGGHSAGDKDGSPSPKEGGSSAKRKKTASGSGGSTCSKDSGGGGSGGILGMPPLVGLGGLNNGGQDGHIDVRRDLEDKHLDDLKDHPNNPASLLPLPPGLLQGATPPGGGGEKGGGGSGGNIANYVPNQRLEWKRYKQYTRNDIMSAIEEVKKGMSALQASRKYGVPSRTLYDKVKKMGITTGRQVQKKSLPQYPASFPSLNMMNLDSYKDMAERMKDLEDNDSNSHPGSSSDRDSHMDGRATMVPPGPGGLNALHMLNIMERMKGNKSGGGNGDGPQSEISLTPMNLSTMLGRGGGEGSDLATLVPLSSASAAAAAAAAAAASSTAAANRMSESSMSPNGGDDVDMDDDDDNERGRGRDEVPSEDLERRSSRDRHPSADIRAQFMADLRRLGGNIPSSLAAAASASPAKSPPAATAARSTSSPPPSISSSSSTKAEETLPPRKRKVSHDLHEQAAAEKFNGIQQQQQQEEPTSSSVSSPEKSASDKKSSSGDAIGDDSNSLVN